VDFAKPVKCNEVCDCRYLHIPYVYSGQSHNAHGAVIMSQSLQKFARFIWRMQNSVKWMPSLWSNQATCAASLPLGCFGLLHPTSPPIVVTEPKSWWSICNNLRATDGRKLRGQCPRMYTVR